MKREARCKIAIGSKPGGLHNLKAEGLAAEAAMRLADTLMAGQLAYPKRTLLQPHGVERKAAAVERKAAGAERKAAGGDLLSHFGKVWKTSPLFFPTTLREHALRKWE